MGYGLCEDESQRKLQGEVVYRKRNIRRQSFQLMAELKRLKTMYKTIDSQQTIRDTNKVRSMYLNTLYVHFQIKKLIFATLYF